MEELLQMIRDVLAAWEWWFGDPLIPLLAVPAAQAIVGLALAWVCLRGLREPGRRP